MAKKKGKQAASIVASLWRWSLRLVGLAGLIYISVEREHPDTLLVMVFTTMIGLPLAVDLDRARNGKDGDR